MTPPTPRTDTRPGPPGGRELPPPPDVPLDRDGPELARVPYRVRFLAHQLLAGRDVLLATPTRTRVDVGSWLLRGRVWLFATAEDLVVVAAGLCGPRPRAARIRYDDLRESQYNHVTGQLALAPVEHLPFRGLAIDPVEGLQCLALIYREDT